MKTKKNVCLFSIISIFILIIISCSKSEEPTNNNETPQSGYTNVQGTDYIIDIPNYKYSGIVNAINLVDNETKVKAAKISFKYLIGAFFGEPTRSGIFMSQGNTGEAMIYSINIRTKVLYPNGDFSGFYYDYSPGVSTTNGEWGWDTTGSPSWSKIFNDGAGGYATSTQAKDIYKAGFYLDKIQILSINGVSK